MRPPLAVVVVGLMALVKCESGGGSDHPNSHDTSRCAPRCAIAWGPVLRGAHRLPTMQQRHASAQCAQWRMAGPHVSSGAEAEMSRRKKGLLCVRIKIMEDVVRRVNDPALSYHRKRETVEELEGYLHRMRALTADRETDVDVDAISLAPQLERAPQPRVAAPDTQQQQREVEIGQVLARMREAKVIAVLRGKNKQRCVCPILLVYTGIVLFDSCTLICPKHPPCALVPVSLAVTHSLGLTPHDLFTLSVLLQIRTRLIDRGLELAKLGCRCMEVTIDTFPNCASIHSSIHPYPDILPNR